MSLFEQFRAIADEAGTPPNEAATCRWIIDPLLTEVLGYGRTEWVPEEIGAAGNKPDYTVLPGTRHTWFLEAKAWTIGLTDQHAIEATTYAHQSGKRWVTLTNGHEWRVYDLDLPGQPPEKLAMHATSATPDAMEALLEALTREKVVSGGLDAAARRALLRKIVAEQIADAESDIVKAIWNVARKLPGLASVTRVEVVEAMTGQGSPTRPAQHETPAPEDGADVDSPPARTAPQGTAIAITGPALKPTGASPAAIVLPDSSAVSVTSWKRAFVECVRWLADNAPRPLPVPWSTGSRSRRRLWTNTTPFMADGTRMRAHVQINARGQTIYLETHASAQYLVSLLTRLCAEVGVDPSQIRVTLR